MVIWQSINGVVVCGDLVRSPTQTKGRSDYSINIPLCFPSNILTRRKTSTPYHLTRKRELVTGTVIFGHTSDCTWSVTLPRLPNCSFQLNNE